LTTVLVETDRAADAEPFARQALEVSEACFGKDDPATARALSQLAMVLDALNRKSEAVPLARRAIEITEQHLDPRHPRVALQLTNLAVALGNTPEAEALLRRALDIDEHNCAPDDQLVAEALHNLAFLLHQTGRSVEAAPLERRAVEICLQNAAAKRPVRILQYSLGWYADMLIKTGMPRAEALNAVNELAESYGVGIKLAGGS
jgi:tetratricopeptide (TPR) repeat protein